MLHAWLRIVHAVVVHATLPHMIMNEKRIMNDGQDKHDMTVQQHSRGNDLICCRILGSIPHPPLNASYSPQLFVQNFKLLLCMQPFTVVRCPSAPVQSCTSADCCSAEEGQCPNSPSHYNILGSTLRPQSRQIAVALPEAGLMHILVKHLNSCANQSASAPHILIAV